jgi:glycosyltransferase involved in cell wall biosynthesis
VKVTRLLEVNAVGTLVGGVERTLQVVGRELQREGVQLRHVYLQALAPGEDVILPEVRWDVLPDLSPHNHFDGVRPEFRLRRNLDQARLERIIAEFGPDVIHLNNIYSPIPLLASIGGVPVVRTVHDYRFVCVRLTKLLPSGGRCSTAPGIRCLLRRCVPLGRDRAPLLDFLARSEELEHYRDLPFLVTKSAHMKRTLVQSGIPSRSVTVIPCCIPLPELSTASSPREDWLLYAGRLSAEKGVDRLLEACALLAHDWRLKIAGEGSEQEKLQRLAERLGLARRIDWLGHLSYAELCVLYRRCRLLVVPSVWDEPFGLVGLEAMAHAMPVVACDVGGTSEWLQDGQVGTLVEPDHPRSLADALDTLLRDPVRADTLGENGRRAVAERFSPQRIAAEFLAYLNRVAATSRDT